MRSFHEGEERSGVVQVDARTDSLSGDRGEFHRFARLPGDPTRQNLPKRVFYDRCQRLARVMGEAFGRFQQLIIKSNGRTHVAKHIDQASICQAAFPLAKDERQGPFIRREGPFYFSRSSNQTNQIDEMIQMNPPPATRRKMLDDKTSSSVSEWH
jgi:hypothetical protein